MKLKTLHFVLAAGLCLACILLLIARKQRAVPLKNEDLISESQIEGAADQLVAALVATDQTEAAAAEGYAIGSSGADQGHYGQEEASLLRAPIVAKWKAEYGISEADIRLAQDRLQARGFPAAALNDPALVFQFMPRRLVPALRPDEIFFPKQASAGAEIPFRIKGALPDASVTFTAFEVALDGWEIRIRPVGKTSGEPAPGIELPFETAGAVPPLSAGVYRVIWPDFPDQQEVDLVVN